MRILLAMPQYGPTTHRGAFQAGLVYASEKHQLIHTTPDSSLLPKTFNLAWCTGLTMAARGEIDLFAMLHNDVMPENGWLDLLVDELERTGADVLSCVIPIKDDRGITSTAIDCAEPWDDWHCEKRLTMREVMKLPVTFTAADCGYPDRALLVNTGCWVCRITDKRFRQLDNDGMLDFCFRLQSQVRPKDDGTYEVQTISEDWDFGRWLHGKGFCVRATRCVSLKHFAMLGYPNDVPWGSCETEERAKEDAQCVC